MSKMSCFDIKDNIVKGQAHLTDEELSNSDMSNWMLNKIFSNHPRLILLADKLNTDAISKKMVYDCFYYGVKRLGRVDYFAYNSKKATEDKMIKYIMDFHNVDQRTAKRYNLFLSEEEKEQIVEFFENRGTGKSTKKKKK